MSSAYDKTVRIWSARDFSAIKTLKGHEDKVTSVDVSPGMIQSIFGDGMGLGLEMEMGVEMEMGMEMALGMEMAMGFDMFVCFIDGKTLVSCSFDRTWKSWAMDETDIEDEDVVMKA